jgi:hypothetical protein
MPQSDSSSQRISGPPTEPVPLGDLQFDLRNPRYGAKAAGLSDERETLNHIVGTFGVQDGSARSP